MGTLREAVRRDTPPGVLTKEPMRTRAMCCSTIISRPTPAAAYRRRGSLTTTSGSSPRCTLHIVLSVPDVLRYSTGDPDQREHSALNTALTIDSLASSSSSWIRSFTHPSLPITRHNPAGFVPSRTTRETCQRGLEPKVHAPHGTPTWWRRAEKFLVKGSRPSFGHPQVLACSLFFLVRCPVEALAVV
jgi:hypothetical protein